MDRKPDEVYITVVYNDGTAVKYFLDNIRRFSVDIDYVPDEEEYFAYKQVFYLTSEGVCTTVR